MKYYRSPVYESSFFQSYFKVKDQVLVTLNNAVYPFFGVKTNQKMQSRVRRVSRLPPVGAPGSEHGDGIVYYESPKVLVRGHSVHQMTVAVTSEVLVISEVLVADSRALLAVWKAPTFSAFTKKILCVFLPNMGPLEEEASGSVPPGLRYRAVRHTRLRR